MHEINISHRYENIRYGVWINPNSKGVMRYKPIEFTEALC